MSDDHQAAKKPLTAEYVSEMHTAAKLALTNINWRRKWPNSEAGSPVSVLLLCSEVARLNIVNADLLDAAKAVCWFDWSGNDPDAQTAIQNLRAVIAKATGGGK